MGRRIKGSVYQHPYKKPKNTEIVRSCDSKEIKLKRSCDVELKGHRVQDLITSWIPWGDSFITKRSRKNLNQLRVAWLSCSGCPLSWEQNAESRRKGSSVQELLEHLSSLKFSVACPCFNNTCAFFIFDKSVWVFYPFMSLIRRWQNEIMTTNLKMVRRKILTMS